MSITLIIVFVMFAGLVPSAIGLSQYCNTIAYLQTDIQVQIKVLKVVEVNSKDEKLSQIFKGVLCKSGVSKNKLFAMEIILALILKMKKTNTII